VRIGGIYALERIARDSARDHPTVMEVLSAFIREHSREPWPPPGPDDTEKHRRSTRPDIQAALTVISRAAKSGIGLIDLAGANLAGANLAGMTLTGVNLQRADLRYADLTSADLTRVNLVDVDLRSANLTRANLAGAYFLPGGFPRENRLLRNDWIPVIAKLTGAQLSDATWPAHAMVPVGWKLNADSGRLEEWTDDPRRPKWYQSQDDGHPEVS